MEESCEPFRRTIKHTWNRGQFPHEMGLLLGYPVEDVKYGLKELLIKRSKRKCSNLLTLFVV